MAPDSTSSMASRRNTTEAIEVAPSKPKKPVKKKSVQDERGGTVESTEKKATEKPAIQLQAPIPKQISSGDVEKINKKKQTKGLRAQESLSTNGELLESDNSSAQPSKQGQELVLGTSKKKQAQSTQSPKKKKQGNDPKLSKQAPKTKTVAQFEDSDADEEALPVYRISYSGGGVFLPIEPAFSRNEQFMFLAHPHALRVYSTKTSLLHRIFYIPRSALDLPPTSEKRIVSYCVDPLDENNIYIATGNGKIFLWNWAEDNLVGNWDTNHTILHLEVCSSVDNAVTTTTTIERGGNPKKNTVERTVYIVAQSKVQSASKKDKKRSKPSEEKAHTETSDKATRSEETAIEKKRNNSEKLTDILIEKELKRAPWEFLCVNFEQPSNDKAVRIQKLHKLSSPITSFKVLAKGTIIVAVSGKTLWIGNKNRPTAEREREPGQDDSLREDWGTWRYYTVESEISCMDVSVVEGNPKSGKKAKQPGDGRIKGYVVVGDVKGHIYLWHDILNMSNHGEKPGDFRHLHWHRNAVGSVKISRDGNYLISGGNETVLVLWQIDTGRKQFLPHLTAAIEHIVVSPSGTSYGVRLSDNSAMVLSTTELKPKANIAGLQAGTLPVYLPSQPDASIITANDLLRHEGTNGGRKPTHISPPRVTCVLHPAQSNQLLLAASSHSTSSLLVTPEAAVVEPCPYLQTYDILSDRPVAKQALTRTHVTDIKIGPAGNTLIEPNVRLLSVSNNGEWLASLDEWSPPIQDVYDHALLDPNNQLQGGREVFLKFWHRNNANWELVTRVDSPHPHATIATFNGGAKVLDLVTLSSINNPGFATLGADGSVRIWKPRVRTRGGVVVKHRDLDKGGVKSGPDIAQANWGCRKVIHFLKADAIAPTPSFGGVLAVSHDGSVLAVAVNVASVTTSLSSAGAQTRNAIYILDPSSGLTLHTLLGLQSGEISSLKIIDRYLVILGTNKLIVFDLVRGRVRWELPITYLIQRSEPPRPEELFMDADITKGTIAVGIIFQYSNDTLGNRLFHRREDNDHCQWGSVLSVFDVSHGQPIPIFRTVKHGIAISALKAVPSFYPTTTQFQEGSTAVESGYLYLDSFAKVNYLIPSTVTIANTSLITQSEPSPATGLSTIYGTAPSTVPDEEMLKEQDEDEEQEVVDTRAPVSAEMLSNVLFSHTGVTTGDKGVVESMQQVYGMMDLAEVFDRVVELYARPPLQGGEEEEEQEEGKMEVDHHGTRRV